jgi:hypothetical protein
MGMHRVARVVALLVFFTLALTLTRFNRRQYLPSPFRSPEGGFGKESDPQQVLTATAEPSKSATQGELSCRQQLHPLRLFSQEKVRLRHYFQQMMLLETHTFSMLPKTSMLAQFW